jgi:hypothetical protein
MRQERSLVEARVHLGPADVRAAFRPQARVMGDDAVPSLLGVLTAGGDNGKTELLHGWTWSTTIVDDADAARVLGESLQHEIQEWVRERTTLLTAEFRFPEEPENEWFVRSWKRYVTVYVPMHRQSCLPWDVFAEDFSRPLDGAP